MNPRTILAITALVSAVAGLLGVFFNKGSDPAAAPSKMESQNSSGNIQIAGSGNVVQVQSDAAFYKESREAESDSINVLEVTERFYNDYLKYLNKKFSKTDDESGFSEPPSRNPDGSLNLTKIKSAPAYGVSKLSLAEYLYTREEISHSFAQKIDELIRKAKRDDPELGGLGYDPILMAQDTPSSLDFSKPSVTGNAAKIIVYTVWTWNGNSTKNPINVSLKKTGRTWRISDISDGSR